MSDSGKVFGDCEHGHRASAEWCVTCLRAEVAQLRHEVAGYRKTDALWRAGMESAAEQLHDLKQRARELEAGKALGEKNS